MHMRNRIRSDAFDSYFFLAASIFVLLPLILPAISLLPESDLMTEAEEKQDLYSCNGCTEQIPTQRARVSCHSCTDYNLCANCFVIKQFNPPHIESRSTMVLKQSGFVVPLPPGFPPRPPPALPPRQISTVNTRQTIKVSELPTANWGALWNVLKGPLDKKDKKRKESVDATAKDGLLNEKGSPDTSSLAQNPVNQFPPSPPKSVRGNLNRFDSTAPSYPRPAEWEPLFEADSTPTPIFVAFMSTIFGHLDPEHTGFLSPEVYSNFLDLQGYESASNIWKHAYESDGGESRKEVADLELGLYYSDLNISHTLKIRLRPLPPPDEEIEEPKSAVSDRIKDSMRFSANMPMLSRQGFLDLGAIEYLRDPSRGHEYIKSISRTFWIWTELGDIPRTILPETSIPKQLLAEKLESEPENAIPKVLLAEKLVQEEEKTKEMDGQGGYESEELKAGSGSPSPSMQPPHINPVLTQMKGGEAKVESLIKEEKFDEADEFAETRQELVSDDDDDEEVVQEQETDEAPAKDEASLGEEQVKHGKLAASMAENSNVEKEETADKGKGKETAAPFTDLYKED